MSNQKIYFICGVSGSGKSTVGKLLAKKLNVAFIDGDDFHSQDNIKKMKAGNALNDEDRKGWLTSIHNYINQSENSIVCACSALKEKYRKTLLSNSNKTYYWIFLNGKKEVIHKRMQKRKGHFMPENLLSSQFDILEIPSYALTFSINKTPNFIVEKIIQKTEMKKQLGIIGLGVMGKSLSRNFANHGVSLSLYNRYVKDVEENIASNFIRLYPELKSASGYEDLSEFVNSLDVPRKVFMMISAGEAVDSTIDALIPLLDKGDLIIDGGNSHYKLTQARNNKLDQKGIYFIGTGVSGGEEGALKGPSIMPGGKNEAYLLIKNELEAIAAKDKNGKACCGLIGKGGAGHFVKMVHNGIEYGEMQLIAEVYGILKNGEKLSNREISDVFEKWLDGEASSYLLEITIQILRKKENEIDLIDIILDKAGNKGTGSWTTIAACELGVPVPTLTAALFARYQSAFKEERINAEATYQLKSTSKPFDLPSLYNAYLSSRIINHHQGLHLIQAASESYDWEINIAEVCRIWTNGCIIRSELMETLKSIVNREKELLLHPFVVDSIKSKIDDLRDVVGKSSSIGLSIPCFQASLSYFETYTKSQSTANIIQGQRDYFGAHRYQRIDDPTNKTYHTKWENQPKEK